MDGYRVQLNLEIIHVTFWTPRRKQILTAVSAAGTSATASSSGSSAMVSAAGPGASFSFVGASA